MNRLARSCSTLFLLTAIGTALAQEKPPIIIRPKVADEVKLAAADLQPKNRSDASGALSDALTAFNTTLWDDLVFCGWFTLENKALYPTAPISEPDHIRFADWKTSPLAVDFLAMGNGKIEGRDLVIEARLYDIKTQAQVVGQKYRALPDQARVMAHNFADEVVYYLTAGASHGVAATQLAFVSKRSGSKEIYLMDYDGSNQKPLTRDRSIAILPSWSADNSKIAFVSFRTGYPEINILALVGQARQPFPAYRSLASSPDLAPDGKSIAYAARSPETGFTNLYVSSGDWSKRINLTSSKSVDTSPSWSPTGRQIVFLSDRTGPAELYMIDPDGANLKQLTFEKGQKDSPDWSPDGRYIVYTWRPEKQPFFDLYMLDLTTNKTYQLTSNGRNNENPAWAPDGRHIAFQSNRDGSDQIYVMVSDGTSVKKLTSGGISNEAPAWGNYPRK